jgi:hypothetical protein
MRGRNAISVEVVSPSKGLLTRIPSNQPSKVGVKGSFTVATNVRFDDGVVRNAPGFKQVKIFGELTGDVNLIVQDQLIESNFPPFKSPFLGTSDKIYWISRDVYVPPDILAYSILTAESLGTGSVSTPTAIVLDPDPILSQEFVSAPSSVNASIAGTSIASLEAFGTFRIDLEVTASGIASAEDLPQPTVS